MSSQQVLQLPKWILVMGLSVPTMASGIIINSVPLPEAAVAGFGLMTFGLIAGMLQAAWRAKNA